jgi:hypothetical protein
MKNASMFLVGAVLLSMTPDAADARVVRLTVEQTRPFAGGKSFGDAGPFVRLEGTAHFEVDPKDPLNAVIVNLDKAPRNGKGMVEFRTRFVIIKPVDMARGNHKTLYGINNRGNPIELRFHEFPAAADLPEGGDGLIFRLGYTFVDAGWAGDVVTTDSRLGAELPVAVRPDGSPIVARIRIEYEEADLSGYTTPLKGDTRFRSYETADTNTASSVFTVRDSIGGAKKVVPSNRWTFGRCPTGQASLAPSTRDLCFFDGFQKNKIYELVYPAKNPWVIGLGYAVTRDLASFLRNATKDDAGTPNPLAQDATTVGIRRAYATGTSSTGMYLRDFLYLGFNEDEAHRRVFDAVRILIPGTHRLFANVEFANPDVYSRQDEHHDFVSYSHPPLSYAVTTDPITGTRDGILKRPATDPLVLHVDSSNEFWQMNASLNVHDGRGKPVPVPDNVRLFLMSSHPHGGGAGVAAIPTSKGVCEYPMNGGNAYNPVVRALLVALDDWADRGIAPPSSRYPDVRDGTLVTRADADRSFPKIPGAKFPGVVNELSVLDFGPKFGLTGGWLTKLPPARGGHYQVLVPKPDSDGLDLGGVRTPDVAAPVGTQTGWNLIAAGPRGTDLCGLSGSFFPFATTRAERLANNDSRPSLEERYKDHAGFMQAVEQAARGLVKERLMLEEDAQKVIEIAKKSSILQ